jgi:hypothetical protein
MTNGMSVVFSGSENKDTLNCAAVGPLRFDFARTELRAVVLRMVKGHAQLETVKLPSGEISLPMR